MLEIRENFEIIKNLDREEFLSFIAGFFDAEGSVVKRRHRKKEIYVIKIGNTRKQILEIIKNKLETFGIMTNVYKYSDEGRYHYYKGRLFINRKKYYVLEIAKKKDVLEFLKLVNIKHPEKVKRKEEVLKLYSS